MSPPCRFYNTPGGCRHGQSCKFSHSAPGNRDEMSPRTSLAQRAPPGICNFYWSSGSCRHEFNCRYHHTRDPSASAPSSSEPAIAGHSLAPFLTEAGLAKLNGLGTDVFFAPPSKPLSPNETHNHLKRFLHDNFRFQKTFEVYGFLVPLGSLDTSGPSWAPEDGPLLLTSLATGNGLLRISDIFQWPSVSSRAGSSQSVLSFQRGYVPLLKFYSSEFVVKSALNHLINGLYMRILDYFPNFCTNLNKCMQECMDASSFEDSNAHRAVNKALGSQIISSLTVVFFEILTRFKNATAMYPDLIAVVGNLGTWMETWIEGILMSPPAFDDPFEGLSSTARDQIIGHLRAKVNRVVAIIAREERKLDRAKQQHAAPSLRHIDTSHEGVVAALNITYEGAGALRPLGPRHDNDSSDIADIRIAPTHEELICRLPPFLPGNFRDAPHHLPAESMERLLDIQFRLLREELTAPLRTSVQLIREDMMSASPRTTLSKLIDEKGGKYRGHTEGQEQVLFNVYTNVNFTPLAPDRRGLSVGLTIDTPPGRARQSRPAQRGAFWESMSGKRLMQGGLVGLVWKRGDVVDVHLGILASSTKALVESATSSEGSARVSIRVVFYDPTVEVRILNALKYRSSDVGTRVLAEAAVMFEAIRPFLEALRVEPESLPFAKYLVHRRREFLSSMTITSPRYALVPGFTYQLASLFPPDAGVDDLKLDVSDPSSVAFAREQLRTSRLDASQCEAVVDTLTRELAMIQGPPGTGKSYTGVEILRVLLANKVKPILMIAFTNHALDHMLTSVLDAEITNKVVRLGSRSMDEKISKYSMETIEMVAGRNRLDQSFRRHYRDLKVVEEEIRSLMNKFLKADITSDEFESYLEVQYTEHYDHLHYPPTWVNMLRNVFRDRDDSTWMRAGKRGKSELDDDSIYAYWRDGKDLEFLDKSLHHEAANSHDQRTETRNRFTALDTENSRSSDHSDASPVAGSPSKSDIQEAESDESSDEDSPEDSWQADWPVEDSGNVAHINEQTSGPHRPSVTRTILENFSERDSEEPLSPWEIPVQVADLKHPTAFFGAAIPSVPDGDRPLDLLLAEGTMWTFSRRERKRLHYYWSSRIREKLHDDQLQDFQSLRSKHASILKIHQEGRDETRRQLLQDIDIVGCTTTGAAQLSSLLKSLAPRVMLVEEAGQVLEAHILGSLVPSVEHLILIGDPLQLRPTLNNYSLSMDNKRGKQLFKFDMSLMERLASNGLSMSQIDVQRRMRPTIANLVRNTLYPSLQDHELVCSYPDVRGFSKNVFFLTHTHRENGGAEESASKYNTFEVDMIKDLVLYLLRQGCYSEEGDIVVLCAYLGQLARVRDALSNEVAVIIEGRDKENLAEQEEDKVEEESQVERIKVTKRVRLRTVDNYQGEEARIVILSTVRNVGSRSEDSGHTYVRPTIGFLRSENRTNVALSRAKEGLFILGNAAQLASGSDMWRQVTEELENGECLGTAFPVSCHQHPDTVERISEPGKLPLFAPDGGCLKPCNYRLKCGHVCHYKCHPDDPKHIAVACPQACRRLCPRMHPCNKECSEDCGKCMFPVSDVELPCGHRIPSIECYRLDSLHEVTCTVSVTKAFPTCEHSAAMMCSSDPSNALCTSVCGGIMTCCGRTCSSRCHLCQGVNQRPEAEQRIEAEQEPEAEPRAEKIARIQHVPHTCQKPLFCAHPCSKPCSKDHECATTCHAECRQQCSHSRCKSNCSTPCSPCQKECTWTCLHHQCPLPCGSVCARLPCDKRCTNTLLCGHRCPSVCGEDCSTQICPVCASDDLKQNIVDLLLYRKLEDIAEAGDTLDELLITLKCKHVFTVETLDGHCGIGDFYTREGTEGKWLGLRSPENSSGKIRAPPVCPTCRTAITAPRYGRIFKSADLDILERNIISRMTQSLNRLQLSMARISKTEIEDSLGKETVSLKISTISGTTSRKSRVKARKAVLNAPRNVTMPISLEALLPSNADLHALSPSISDLWQRATRQLTTMYSEALKVANTRSAHVYAWEAAFSCLYQKEMDLASSDPARAPRRPAEHAMRMARMKVGQPQPRADKRFLVEAYWATLKLRFMLADLSRGWMKELLKKGPAFKGEERSKWGSFGLFILDSCVKDAAIAYSIAADSESRRQMTTTSLLAMKAQLDRFGFRLDMIRASDNFQQDRVKVLAEVAEQIEDAEAKIASTVEEHVAVLPNDGQNWIPNNFTETARMIVDEWKKMEVSIHTDTFYEPLSLDEQMKVVQALNFSHTGHFYQCPQGHVYVITECGGAMERSSCPECGASIGGTSHTLDSTNARAMEFERMAREAGSDRSPWQWAQF
ncbi:P-loop containing nucleoside triphosphate hydrolase protein [Mycena sp. CBHHK59/15]|nr:P-loop containing nucleoside triphosphate hydrolase protein [Mycena sp. CBHHK59/15]